MENKSIEEIISDILIQMSPHGKLLENHSKSFDLINENLSKKSVMFGDYTKAFKKIKIIFKIQSAILKSHESKLEKHTDILSFYSNKFDNIYSILSNIQSEVTKIS